MRLSVLSSGSRANCCFVETGSTRILIDCGLSARQAAVRLASLGIDAKSLDAIIVTHEHTDHLSGVANMSRRFGIPVYTNLRGHPNLNGASEVRRFDSDRGFIVKDMTVHPFSISHDAVDPVGFRIEGAGHAFGYATDLGFASPLVRTMLEGVDALVLEANHCPDMLSTCGYPWVVKQRIASSHGHLANEDAALLLDALLHPRLQLVVLAHLSENSNTPDRARSIVGQVIPSYSACELVAASVVEPTALFDLAANEARRSAAG